MTGEEYIKRKDLHPYWDYSRDPNREDVSDAFEQGKTEGNKELLEKAWNETDLAQWYIANVDGHEPIWTDKHIEELCNDFYLIPKKIKL